MTQELATEIAAAEQHLRTLRARRDALIVRRFEAGESKYRLAKDWNLSENTITRIVTGVKPGRKQPAEQQRDSDVPSKHHRDDPSEGAEELEKC